MHIFKSVFTLIIFIFIINSLSIANPVSQTKTPPQKTEQTRKKKPNFIQKITLKKIENKIKHDGDHPSSLSQTSMWLGIGSFLSIFTGGIGLLVAVAAIITGIIVLKRGDYNKKSKSHAIAGIALGATLIFLTLLFVGTYLYLLNQSW